LQRWSQRQADRELAGIGVHSSPSSGCRILKANSRRRRWEYPAALRGAPVSMTFGGGRSSTLAPGQGLSLNTGPSLP
jgi:hypothetical protein